MFLFLKSNLTTLLCHDFTFRKRTESTVEHLSWNDFAKMVNNFWPLTVFAKKLHHGFSTRF